MTARISVLCLLLTVHTLLGLVLKQAQYKREDGKFANSPEVTVKVPSRMACSGKCTAMKPWFCGGFTYHNNGDCDLHKGSEAATCVNPETAAPALVANAGSEPRSHRRHNSSTCPGSASEPCGCPAGFTRCAGRCLILLTQRVNYADATARCAARGAHLAVPRSEGENNCARTLAEGEGTVLIGATCLVKDGEYVGVDGDCGPVPVLDSWWAEGEPKDGAYDEDCAIINGRRWEAAYCGWRHKTLCQLRDCYQPQCQTADGAGMD